MLIRVLVINIVQSSPATASTATSTTIVTAMEYLKFDPATKVISVDQDSVAYWSEQDVKDYSHEVNTLNALAKQLVATNADVPPPPNQITENLSKQVTKLRDTALKEAKQGKDAEAIKLLTMALDMALRRPVWEAVQYQTTQIVVLLSDRCNVFIKLNKWADAYADAHILTTLQPAEWSNYFRKARCLRRIEKYGEAKALLATALELGKNDAGALIKVNEEINDLNSLC